VEGGAISIGKISCCEAVGGALPLVDVVGDHARRLHRGLAELGVAGDFALDALALGMQQVAQALELGDQLLDFRKRGAGDALDQRVDIVDRRLGCGSTGAVSGLWIGGRRR